MPFFSKLRIGRDDNGYVTNEIPWPSLDQHYKINLTIGQEETLSVPIWAYLIKHTVSPGASVWCGFGSTPLVLATGNFSKEKSELNPITRSAFDHLGTRISTLRFMPETDGLVSVIFYGKYDSDISR